MTESTGQVSRDAARQYEAFFVPALFRQWGPALADAAAVAPGDRALDVACGTGVVTRALAGRLGAAQVVGLDVNEGMLAVAREVSPTVDFRVGVAGSLPFEDGAFDAVTCAFGLMFFPDRAAAIGEMWRVLRPGGRLVVAVWAGLDHTPGYAALVELLDRLFGAEVADELRSPFVLGSREALAAPFMDAGIDARIDLRPGTARFDSLEAWVRTDIRAWTLADRIDDMGLRRLLDAAPASLGRFVRDGAVEFQAPALLAVAPK